MDACAAEDRRPNAFTIGHSTRSMDELIGILRAWDVTRLADIRIALTAAASERDKQRGMEAGFYRYLTKPVNVDEFLAALDALLASRR